MIDIETFVKERNEALFSFDKAKIDGYLTKYSSGPIPDDDDVFWGGVAKAVLGITNAPEDARQKAMDILDRLGWSYTIW